MSRARSRRLLSVAISVSVLAATGSGASAQRAGSSPRFQPELRADFIDARASAAHLGIGFSVPASTYVRLGLVAGIGRAWANGESTTAGRVDALARFVVDPLREFRWAPYGSGGVSGLYDGDRKWRAVLVGALGVEGPQRGAIVPAIEVGFGGGLRVGVALRRAMPGRR